MTTIETHSTSHPKPPDPESFRFEFALPPDANVLIAIHRQAQIHDPASPVRVDEATFTAALHQKYGPNPITARQRAIAGKARRKTLALKWLYGPGRADCNPSFSRRGLAGEASNPWQRTDAQGKQVPRPEECAASLMVSLDMPASGRYAGSVSATTTTLANDGEVYLNRRRFEAYERSSQARSIQLKHGKRVSAALGNSVASSHGVAGSRSAIE